MRIVDLKIQNKKIVSIARSENKPPISSEKNYDAKGRLALPAFIDSHCHLFSLAEIDEEVQLQNCRSICEMQNRIKKHITLRKLDETTWIYGRGWDQDLFVEKRFPSKQDLDRVTDYLPMVMSRICGHIAVINSAALNFFMKKGAFTGLSEEFFPSDSKGSPSGIVKETALTNCWRLNPKISIRAIQRLFLKAQSHALSFGLSGVHCILEEMEQFEAIRSLDRIGKVKLKLSLFLPIHSLQKFEQMKVEKRRRLLIGNKFQVLGFKLFADGSLGARTAALNEDYADDAGNRGILNYTEDQIIDYARRMKKLGLLLATHAIGDRAVEQVAQAYKKAGVRSRDRFRIEHCSVIRPKRISDLSGIVLAIQPMFATSDYWLKDRIGNSRFRRVGYAFRSLGKKNLLLGSSDAPVESIDPLTGIYAASKNKADPKESLSLANSIQLYTLNAAKQSPLTCNSGSIRIGRVCDVVILDAKSPKSIPKSKVVDLFIDGIRIPR